MNFGVSAQSLIILLGILFFVGATELTQTGNCPCRIDTATKTAICHSRNLTALPECIPSTTEVLDISDSDLKYRAGQFQRFANLTYLDLSRNYDFNPFSDSFIELVNLQVLFLNYTFYTNPESRVFAGLIHLQKLALFGNVDCEDLRADIFAGLSELTHLIMGNNRLINIQEGQFTGHQKTTVSRLKLQL